MGPNTRVDGAVSKVPDQKSGLIHSHKAAGLPARVAARCTRRCDAHTRGLPSVATTVVWTVVQDRVAAVGRNSRKSDQSRRLTAGGRMVGLYMWADCWSLGDSANPVARVVADTTAVSGSSRWAVGGPIACAGSGIAVVVSHMHNDPFHPAASPF